jgi:hypothetical protein
MEARHPSTRGSGIGCWRRFASTPAGVQPGRRDRHLRALQKADIADREIQLSRLRKLLEQKRLTLEVTPAAMAFLAEHGYDPVYGARPLKRAIQKYVQDPLALKVLGGEFLAGDTIKVDAGKGELRFSKTARACTPASSGRAGPQRQQRLPESGYGQALPWSRRGQAWQETSGCFRWRCSDAPARLERPRVLQCRPPRSRLLPR